MAVMIGVDPHKASHTAAAIGPAEEPLGQVRKQACPSQAAQLVAWAAAWPDRTWAVEGATGLGSLLARQLLAAGVAYLTCTVPWRDSTPALEPALFVS